MKNKPKNYFGAIAVMVGYIIGVGMFGLPFLVSKAGIFTFFIFLITLSLVQYLLHLIYANIIVVTKDYHRMPGYAGVYLGKHGKRIVFIAKMISSYGALLAYIIITGIFLHQLLNSIFGGSEMMYATILFLIEAIVIYFGIGMIAKAELFMSGILLLVIILITWKGCKVINLDNYLMIDWKYIFLPYGAMLFALDGNGSLPIVTKLLRRNKEAIKSVIRVATILSVLLITVFTLVIVGVSGRSTTPDALIGLKLILNNDVIVLALIFGILTMVTSFLGVAESIKETLWWDYKINKKLAWALAVFMPYLLYLAGIKDLIGVISFAGAVAGGLCATTMVIIFMKLKKQKNKLVLFKYKPGNIIIYLLIGMFILGMVYEIIAFLI